MNARHDVSTICKIFVKRTRTSKDVLQKGTKNTITEDNLFHFFSCDFIVSILFDFLHVLDVILYVLYLRHDHQKKTMTSYLNMSDLNDIVDYQRLF